MIDQLTDPLRQADALAQVEIFLPPLRERPDDIEPLARHFISAMAARTEAPAPRLSHEAVALLGQPPGPGNLRELRNVLERAFAIATDGVIGVEEIVLGPTRKSQDDLLVNRSLVDIERDAIVATLRAQGGNKTRTASILGIATVTLRDKLKRYEIGEDEYSSS